jgi:benzaldehyde dehydrogenase (NAD)
MAAETGASGLWSGFNVHLAAGMLLEAATLTTQVIGEVIPFNVPGNLATAVRQPAGVVNFVTNAPADAAAVVGAMVAHPAVRRVNFTGPTHVGRIIAGTCPKYPKQSILELGDKAPMLVLDDADIDAAVNGAVFGAFSNSGQIRMSIERIMVDNKMPTLSW